MSAPAFRSVDQHTGDVANRGDFDAECAANRAVMDWIDADPSRRLVGCTPAMVAGLAVNAYRETLGSAPVVAEPEPDSAKIRRDLAHLIDRYHRDAADADQQAAITNLASLLRHSMACNLALTTEIEHYTQEAAGARSEASQ